MNSTEFHNKMKFSNIPMSLIYKVCVASPRFDLKTFMANAPGAFDSNGKLRIKFDDYRAYYHVYCPLPSHSEQKNGDALVVRNDKKSFYCYGGCTTKSLNAIELVMCLILKVSPAIAVHRELSSMFFWPAVNFIVEEIGDLIGVTLAEVSKRTVYKPEVKQLILQATVDYYHFLATEVEFYKNKIDNYYQEERYFKFAPVDFQEIKIKGKLGITPFSKDKQYNKLYNQLKKRGFKDKDILDSRVCIKLDDGRIIDAFRSHAIIPYLQGDRVLGFYGRNLNKKGKIKHKRLAGHYDTPASLHLIVTQEEFMVAEGENTTKALQAMGYKAVIETMGANGFKDEHAVQIKDYRDVDPKKMKRAYTVYDPDKAGRKGTLKIGRRLQNIAHVEVKVIRMPISEKNGEVWYLDANDLFEKYGFEAPEIFEKLKENAISLDAFTFLYLLEEEEVVDFSSARSALQRYASYLDYVPKLERLFIMEELLDLLVPAFKDEIDRSDLRKDLKELLMARPEKTRTEETLLEEEEALKKLGLNDDEDDETNEEDELEDVGPIGPVKPAIEGLEMFKNSDANAWMITQDQEFYNQYKKKMRGLLLVHKIEKLEEELPNGTKTVLYDDSFVEGQFDSVNKFKTYKFRFEEDEKGKIKTIYGNDE